MPRILLASPGSLGDVLPFIALAKALRAAGHEVRLGSSRNNCHVVEANGI
ncbi:glycosyltransferase [Roseomonas populi]|uniref:Glycosyltransferase n=1 Tax=Roseomonas populi TaxID=3121582 RepID=A0ABT1X805_9PROT|nr:glycosyltransferase [Roseomonas pecuniae]MCR0984240.1 glycosyltransferase [Roseomonas pecuniae]